jgi:hypothetical protein
MDHETEVIKQQMAETRESLSEKIDCLEQKVIKTVEGTTDIVANTAESVAEAVQGTVQKVAGAVDHAVEAARDTLDLRKQVEARPWTMFAGSVVVGFVGGQLLTPSRSEGDFSGSSRDRDRHPSPQSDQPREWRPYVPMERGHSSRAPSIFAPAIERLKDLALTAGSSFITEMLLSAAPATMHDDIRATVGEFASALRGHSQPEASSGDASPTPPDFSTSTDFAETEGKSRPVNRMSTPKSGEGNGRH